MTVIQSPMIEVGNLAKTFYKGRKKSEPVTAVQDLSFSVDRGEIFGLLGSNGAGKTTTILMLVTLLHPTSGTARIAGHDVVAERQAVRRLIGSAQQTTGVDPAQTGRQLLDLHARLYGYDAGRARRRVEELLETVGLTSEADRRIGTYSGGQQRLLDLALALVNVPPVLFVDEPTTGLDPAARYTLWQEIERLRADGTTIVLTTQYLEEADRLADRVAFIDHGCLVSMGTPDELKRGISTDVIELEFETGEEAGQAQLDLGDDAGAFGSRVRVNAPDAAGRLVDVLTKLRGADLEPRSVSLVKPTLDDVFLHVTRQADGAASASNGERS